MPNLAADTAKFGVRRRSALKWADVSRWLSNYRLLVAQGSKKPQRLRVLTTEPAQLLDERDMRTPPASRALASASAFFSFGDEVLEGVRGKPTRVSQGRKGTLMSNFRSG